MLISTVPIAANGMRSKLRKRNGKPKELTLLRLNNTSNSEDLAMFAGTWEAKYQGTPFFTVHLTLANGTLGGTCVVGERWEIVDGELIPAGSELATHKIVEAKASREKAANQDRQQDSGREPLGEAVPVELTLIGENQAENTSGSSSAPVTGTATVTGSTCFNSVKLTGTISGTAVQWQVASSDGSQIAQLTATPDTAAGQISSGSPGSFTVTQLSGNYSVSSGSCSDETGTFLAGVREEFVTGHGELLGEGVARDDSRTGDGGPQLLCGSTDVLVPLGVLGRTIIGRRTSCTNHRVALCAFSFARSPAPASIPINDEGRSAVYSSSWVRENLLRMTTWEPLPSAIRWKVVLPRSIPIDLICMVILRLAFRQPRSLLGWLHDGGPSHYRHSTQNAVGPGF